MILILRPDASKKSSEYQLLLEHLDGLDNIKYRVHDVLGSQQTLTEIYLIGDTSSLENNRFDGLEIVDQVIRVSQEYRVLGRHEEDTRSYRINYNGLTFSQDNLHVFAGLCAVDNRENVERMMRALQEFGQHCARMGAYKPRTNPYFFQGRGSSCLSYVFELAGKYGIHVLAMEITHEKHIDEIRQALEQTGNPTGVMLQIGTRNSQNFELLKSVGRQQDFPVLFKRGFGITLNESLNAAEYLASEGNDRVIFCLRGVKTNLGDPHRNLVDFAHIPIVKRLTRMPVCIDPSHSVGTLNVSNDGIPDVFHATVQGVIAGANMILVDFHPEPARALVDAAQALSLQELPWFLEDVQMARDLYERRVRLVARSKDAG